VPRLWQRSHEDIVDLLKAAQITFRKMIKECHPDLPGGYEARAAEVLDRWKQLNRMLARRGFKL
jgi:hypothetical protein